MALSVNFIATQKLISDLCTHFNNYDYLPGVKLEKYTRTLSKFIVSLLLYPSLELTLYYIIWHRSKLSPCHPVGTWVIMVLKRFIFYI